MKLKSFRKAKNIVNRTNWQPTDWEKILTNPTSSRGLISKIYKELKKLITKKPNNPIKKWGIELNQEFTTEETRMSGQRNANQNDPEIPPYTNQYG